MALPDIDTVLSWRGRTIVDEAGEKIGKFEDIYLDTESERPEWAAVKTGLFGRGQVLVPLNVAEEQGNEALRIPFQKAHVEDAPDVDADGELSQDEEARLYAHYGLEYSKEESQTGLPSGQAQQTGAPSGAADRGDPGGAHDERAAADADAASAGAPTGASKTRQGDQGTKTGGAEVTRSEEELDVGVEKRPRERVRLKKYVVTEEVTKKVPVQREEVRVEREPVEGERE